MPRTATTDRVDREALLEVLRPRHQAVLLTRRRDGGAQLSPVTCGVDAEGRIVVSTYPRRAKVANARRDPATAIGMSTDWNDAWRKDRPAPHRSQARGGPLQDGRNDRSGEHPDGDEYRAARTRQGKSLLRITVTRWGPIATGGFPAAVIDKL